jgi:radical SAM superfamily enzyme YgiQ (UPF0313 family)
MRIGLIAMSGIRACDPGLMELGFSLPGFIERGKTIASLPSLGLLTLAALTPPHIEVEYVEVRDLATCDAPLGRYDLVAISSYTAQILEAYALADRYREHSVPVVLGGLHVSVLPDEAAQHCDAVVIGEGELSWPALLRDFEQGRLQPRYGSREAQFDLAEAPLPAYELLDPARYNRLTMQTSRGCPFRCDFCASSILLTPSYKQKPLAKVLAEIRKIDSLWRRPFIEFADDNGLVNRRYWKELLGQLAPLGVRWFTETDISVAGDSELLALMRDSGCAEVLIGLESPEPSALAGIELNRDWKLRQFDTYEHAIRTIQDHGIRVNGCFILGLDGHDESIFDTVYDFVRRTELFDVQITVLTPFPGTPLYQRLEREGRLLETAAWHRCTLFDVNFQPRGMTPEALARGLRKLAVRLYNGEFTNWRRRRFQQCLQTPNRRGRSLCPQ